jgi:hypothetical protein
VVDGLFHVCPYFVSGIPFFCIAGGAGISVKIFFGINKDCPFAGRRCTRLTAMADTVLGFIVST